MLDSYINTLKTQPSEFIVLQEQMNSFIYIISYLFENIYSV